MKTPRLSRLTSQYISDLRTQKAVDAAKEIITEDDIIENLSRWRELSLTQKLIKHLVSERDILNESIMNEISGGIASPSVTAKLIRVKQINKVLDYARTGQYTA